MTDREISRTPDILTEQLKSAQSLQVTGRWQESVDAYTSLLEQFGANAHILNGRGVPLRMLKHAALAIADFTRAKELAKTSGDQEQELTAIVGLIDAFRTGNRDLNFNPWPDVQPADLQQRLYQQAESYVVEAETLITQMPARESIAKINAFTNFGLLYDNMENPQKALESYAKAETIARQLIGTDPANIDFQNRLARTLTNKGVAEEKTGFSEEAWISQFEALTIYLRLGDLRGVGNSMISLGDVMNMLRNPNVARYLYEQAREGSKKGGEIVDPDIHNLAISRLTQLQLPQS